MTGSPKSLLRLICDTLEPVNPSKIVVDQNDYIILNSWSSSEVSSVRYLLYDDESSGSIQDSQVNICGTVNGSEVSSDLLVCAPSEGTRNDVEAGK